MIITLTDQQKALTISFAQVRQVVRHVLSEEGQACDEVTICFVDTPTISQLHQKFFNDPSPTDCISFPLDDPEEATPYRILGEIFVCPDTAIAYALKHQKDPYDETKRYIVHGLLHLLGYDDTETEARKVMKKAEEKHMRRLKKVHLH